MTVLNKIVSLLFQLSLSFKSNESLELNTIYVSPSQGLIDHTLKPLDILSEKLCRIMIQGVVRIRLVKEINQSVNDSIDVQYWFPVFTKDVEANISLKVYVWVVDFIFACYLWWIMGL